MKKIWVAVFLGLLFLVMTSQSSFAQSQTATATPSATSNPTLVVMEATLVAQQRQITDLEHKLNYEIDNRDLADRDLLSKWGLAAAIAALGGLALGWFGYGNIKDLKKSMESARDDWKKNVRDLEKEWERHAELMLDKAIFRFDPSNLPIQLPTDLTKIHQALTHRALGKIEFYDDLDDLKGDKLTGVIVISMTDKEKMEGNQQKFLDFVTQRKLDPASTGIILYTGPNRVDDKVSTAFENLVTANYPATVVSSILVVGRGIKIEPSSQKNP